MGHKVLPGISSWTTNSWASMGQPDFTVPSSNRLIEFVRQTKIGTLKEAPTSCVRSSAACTFGKIFCRRTSSTKSALVNRGHRRMICLWSNFAMRCIVYRYTQM